MIRLDVEDYCQDCDDFEPVAERTNYYAGEVLKKCDTIVRCKHAGRCASIAEYLKEHPDKEAKA